MHRGFQAAAAFNVVGITLFSRGFTSEALAAGDPGLFSVQGQLLVVLWGLAYLSIANDWRRVPWTCLVFALEKLFFGVAWIRWMSIHADDLPAMAAADPLAAGFYGAYGLGDLTFAAFFFRAFLLARR